MGYQQRTVEPQAGQAAPRAHPAPGKRAPTDRLAPSTGVPVVDAGTTCERDGAEEASCFLDPIQRTRFLGTITARAGIVGANARDALQDSRIEVLLEQPDGWGPLAEFMFYSVTGPIIGMIMKSVKASRFAGAADDIQATLVNVSRSQRKVLQEMASVAPGKASKARFLELVRDSIGPWQVDLGETSVAMLDDAGLTALNDSLDPRVITVDHFKGRIRDMLARFENQRIELAGVETFYRHGELMWIGHGKDRRLIMLEDHGLHHTVGTGDGVKPRDLVAKLGRDKKPIVIDKDLEPMAVTFYMERTGRQPIEMSVEDAVAKGGELARIGSEMIMQVVTWGGAM